MREQSFFGPISAIRFGDFLPLGKTLKVLANILEFLNISPNFESFGQMFYGFGIFSFHKWPYIEKIT